MDARSWTRPPNRNGTTSTDSLTLTLTQVNGFVLQHWNPRRGTRKMPRPSLWTRPPPPACNAYSIFLDFFQEVTPERLNMRDGDPGHSQGRGRPLP